MNTSDFSIFIKNDTLPEGAVITIQEGSGDNLTHEDRMDGNVDYINYNVYTFDDQKFSLFDGGMVMLTELYQNRTIEDNINSVLDIAFDTTDTDLLEYLPDDANTDFFEDMEDEPVDRNDDLINNIMTIMGV